MLSQLKSLIDIYNRYRDNNIILHLIEDNPDLTERQILELKYSTKVKTRALGAIIKMNKDSEPEEINWGIGDLDSSIGLNANGRDYGQNSI